MEKIVRRVTVVDRAGETRETKTVYDSELDDDHDDGPDLSPMERRVRRMLKAQVIQAQEAYDRHLKSADKGGNAWLFEAPQNFMRARRKAMREAGLGRGGMFGRHDDDEED